MLPTSPRNSLAGGRFHSRKPPAAAARLNPSSAWGRAAPGGQAASRTRARPPPTATASPPAIPSIPSMKLNRLRNHSHIRPVARASSQGGSSPWNTGGASPATATDRPIATARTWTGSRIVGFRPRRSSSHDTAASSPAAPSTGHSRSVAPPAWTPHSQAGQSAISTAMPPPRGVGTAWALRGPGRSSTACRRSSRSTIPVSTALSPNTAGIVTTRVSQGDAVRRVIRC